MLHSALAQRYDKNTKRSNFTDGQIIGLRKKQESETPVLDPCRSRGDGYANICKWEAKLGGTEATTAAEEAKVG
jgi:hypothetical protein